MAIETYLDELQHFADETQHAELIAARVEYFAGLGRVSDSEESFEAHLDRFLDWFLFERVLPQTGRTLLDTFLARKEGTLDEETLAVFRDFALHVHGLFLVKKTSKKGVHLRDLFTAKKYFVEEDTPTIFTKGQVFEARLLPFRGQWCFSKGYIFHPLAAKKFIEKRLQGTGPDNEESKKALIRDLAIRRLKADRYKHIDPIQFYKA